MGLFKRLSRLDGTAGLPLAQPHLPVQPYTAGNDVNVVLVRVVMAYGHPRRIGRVKAQSLHEVPRHGLPLPGAQALVRGQGQ